MKTGKVRLIAALLAVLLLCAIPMGALAAETSHAHGVDHTTKGFEAFPANGVLQDGKAYYLNNNVTIEGTPADWAINGNVTICLNGYTIAYDDLTVNGTLTLCDCDDEATSNAAITFTSDDAQLAGKIASADPKRAVEIKKFSAAGETPVRYTATLDAAQNLSATAYSAVDDTEITDCAVSVVRNAVVDIQIDPNAKTTVTLTPNAAEGWAFDHWAITDGEDSTELPLTVEVDALDSVGAVFAPVLTVTGATLYGIANVTADTKLTAAIPGDGYAYSWTKDGEDYGEDAATAAVAAEPGEHTYTCTATAGGWGSNKATLTVYVDGLNALDVTEYELGDVKPQATLLSTPDPAPAITYTYDTEEAGTFTTEAPDAVGNWYVKADVTEENTADRHIPAMSRVYAITVSLAKPEVDAAIPEGKVLLSAAYPYTLPAAVTLTYQWYKETDGAYTAIDGATGETYEVPAGANGKFVVRAVSNSAESANSEEILVTSNAIESLSIHNWTAGVEEGRIPQPTATATYGNTIDFTYAKKGETTYEPVPPTEEGTYYVKAYVAQGVNSEGVAYGSAEKSFEFRVLPANAITGLAIADWHAGMTASTPTATAAFGEIQYTYAQRGTDSYSDAVPTAEGEYTLKATVAAGVADDGTVYGGATATRDFAVLAAITPETNAITDLQINDWVYTPTPSPVISFNAAYGKATAKYAYAPYTEDDSAPYTEATPVNAGRYRLKVSIPAGEEAGKPYTAAESAPVTFTISKAAQSIPTGITVQSTVKGYALGKILGTTTAMEYQRTDEAEWKSCPGTEIAELAAGIYRVRLQETANYLASGIVQATVAEIAYIPATASYRYVYTPLLEVPESLKHTYASLTDLREDMLSKIKASAMGGANPTGYALYDIVVQFTLDSKDSPTAKWNDVHGDVFPVQGVAVTVPYPSGTASADKFYAGHLFTADSNGHATGTYEFPAVVSGTGSLSLALNGASPVMITYITRSSNGSNTNPPVNNTGNGGYGGAVLTGDTNNPMLYAAILGGAVVALGAVIVVPRLRKRKSEQSDES